MKKTSRLIMKIIKAFWPLWMVLAFVAVVVIIVWINPAGKEENPVEVSPTELTDVDISTRSELDVEYYDVFEQEILPDGIYLSYVNDTYLTIGIKSIGNVSGTINFGDECSTYETTFIQDVDNPYMFRCICNKYDLEFLQSGKLKVIKSFEHEEQENGINFIEEYIFLYSFSEDGYTIREE